MSYTPEAADQLASQGAETLASAFPVVRTVAAQYAPELAEGTDPEHMRSAIQALISKHKFAKDGDGTVPAELSAASRALIFAMESERFGAIVRRQARRGYAEPGHGQHDTYLMNIDSARNNLAKVEAELAKLA